MIEKLRCAEKALEYVEDGMILGVGSGSTVREFVKLLAGKVKEGMRVEVIPTSLDTHLMAVEHGIRVTDLAENPEPDLCIDGADQIDRDFNLIKGGGGALTREKIVATASKKFVVIADESKLVERLFMPVPVEILPFAFGFVKKKIEELGFMLNLREGIGKLRPIISDNGNIIADVDAGDIADPDEFEEKLRIPGIVENGIFLADMVDAVIVGKRDGAVVLRK